MKGGDNHSENSNTTDGWNALIAVALNHGEGDGDH
jgi:hypothetical protein